MFIDWFTVSAQIINFLILVWLMKHFLYKPILDAIDARERKIAATLTEANAKKSEAQKEHDAFQYKNQEFDQRSNALLKQATEEVAIERAHLLEEARKAADILSAKRRETLINETRDLNQILRRRIQEEVFSITRKVLIDLSSKDLEECISEMFIHRLRTIDDTSKTMFTDTLKNKDSFIVIQSSFELPEKQRLSLQKALRKFFAADIALRFEVSPNLIGGIELIMQGQKVAWSISDYLTSMEKSINDLLNKSSWKA